MVDNYYHKQDLQILQTREVLSMLYNVNRSKGGPKEGRDFMKTFAEVDQKKEGQPELPNEEIIQKIKKRDGG